MPLTLNHVLVPARDKDESARFLAHVLGLAYTPVDSFTVVRINDTLTFDFAEVTEFESHHYAFRVSEGELDEMLRRVEAAGIAYGSDSTDVANRRLNDWHGGRGFYFYDPAGHLLEVLTQPSPRV